MLLSFVNFVPLLQTRLTIQILSKQLVEIKKIKKEVQEKAKAEWKAQQESGQQ